MKAIFSYINNTFSECPSNEYIKITALSNFLAQKQGFETIFYGNDESIKDFKKINFNHIQKFPDKSFNNLPKCFWSAGKLIALSLMNEPCIHIDNDLFLTKPIPEDFLKNDIVCFHDELFVNEWINSLQNLFKICPEQCLGFPFISYNCGLIGGKDITTIHRSIEILMNFIKINAKNIDDLYLKYTNYPLYISPSVLIEQVWLFQIFKYFNKNITNLVKINNWRESFEKMSKEKGYIHLMKTKLNYKNDITTYLNKHKIKY